MAADPICSAPSCTRVGRAYGKEGLCPTHYREQRATAVCAVEDCTKPMRSRGLCSMHSSRKRLTGSEHQTPSGRVVFGRDKVCASEGCDVKRRKLHWCARHYTEWRRTGTTGAAKEWRTDVGGPCKLCGAPVQGRRSYCTDSCAVLARTWSAGRPIEMPCERCGTPVPVNTRNHGKTQRLRRADVRMCDACKYARTRRHKMSLTVLVQRDGTICGICGGQVLMHLKHPDMMRASVDHRIPFARGGTHDPENLQLAHLLCNVRKRDQLINYNGPRVPFGVMEVS